MGRLLHSKDTPNKVVIDQIGDLFLAYPSCCIGLFTRMEKTDYFRCTCKYSVLALPGGMNEKFTLTKSNSWDFFWWVRRWTGLGVEATISVSWEWEE